MRNQTSLLILTASLLAGPVLAQSNPSAAQLINDLTPTSNLSDTTRGIRALPPSGSSSVAPAGSSLMSPMAKQASMKAGPAAKPSANLDIDFRSGSAVLTPSAAAELNQLGRALTNKTLASYRFEIVGHTDTTGVPATNQTLSEQRAAAVKAYLEAKFGVPDTRLQAKGVGEADPLIPTPPQTPELQNRRVEIVNLGSK